MNPRWNVFKTFTLTWWQTALYKLCVLSFGLLLGSLLPLFFAPLWPLWLAVSAVCGIYITRVWWKQEDPRTHSRWNVFKPFTLTCWHAAVFELCLLPLGLIAGSLLPFFFAPLWPLWLAILVATGVAITWVWWKQ